MLDCQPLSRKTRNERVLPLNKNNIVDAAWPDKDVERDFEMRKKRGLKKKKKTIFFRDTFSNYSLNQEVFFHLVFAVAISLHLRLKSFFFLFASPIVVENN